MKEQNPQNQPHPLSQQHAQHHRQAMEKGKPASSGVTQPHNAKKEALGPNTNR